MLTILEDDGNKSKFFRIENYSEDEKIKINSKDFKSEESEEKSNFLKILTYN